jgi:hypothetical protein
MTTFFNRILACFKCELNSSEANYEFSTSDNKQTNKDKEQGAIIDIWLVMIIIIIPLEIYTIFEKWVMLCKHIALVRVNEELLERKVAAPV